MGFGDHLVIRTDRFLSTLAHTADLALAVVTGRGFAVKRVAETLGVSPSQLIERLKGARKLRWVYHKPDDAELLAPLRSLVDERPTYGYRRIAALRSRRLTVSWSEFTGPVSGSIWSLRRIHVNAGRSSLSPGFRR